MDGRQSGVRVRRVYCHLEVVEAAALLVQTAPCSARMGTVLQGVMESRVKWRNEGLLGRATTGACVRPSYAGSREREAQAALTTHSIGPPCLLCQATYNGLHLPRIPIHLPLQ